MNQRVTKYTKNKVASIINSIDQHIPFAYTTEVINDLREQDLYTELSDERLTQRIMNVRNGRSYHIDIAKAIDKIARLQMMQDGIDPMQASIDALSDEIGKSLKIK
jgi:hypothetical protein